MAGTFNVSRGGDGYEFDWEGEAVLIKAVGAAREGINFITAMAADEARDNHPAWRSRSGQTRKSVFSREAVIEWREVDGNGIPHVWGEWGVDEYPRVDLKGNEVMTQGFDSAAQPGRSESTPLTTKDVALFLEFGTINMQPPRPWLYPVWNATIPLLKTAIATSFRSMR